MYNQTFRKPDGTLATRAEVVADWATFRAQADEAYEKLGYDFALVRHTNWQRLGALQGFVRYLVGDREETPRIAQCDLYGRASPSRDGLRGCRRAASALPERRWSRPSPAHRAHRRGLTREGLQPARH